MKATSLALLASLLLGCVASGAHGTAAIADPAIVAQVEKGKSTKDDVRRILGPPAAVNFSDAGLENWSYVYATNTAAYSPLGVGKQDFRTYQLAVQFGKNGVVENV